MAYNIVYIEDQATESREKDLESLGYNVVAYNPSSDISEVLKVIQKDTTALILDYRLTKGERKATYDAPTIAQTLRSKHSESVFEIPIILMSNENIITDYYDDFTSQDLFDFSLTKTQFGDNKERFNQKLTSFILAYEEIKSCGFDLVKILGEKDNSENLIHSRLIAKSELVKDNVYQISRLVYEKLIRSVGPLIGEDVLSARLGISKSSPDWENILKVLNGCAYNGIFSDFHSRWWMGKISLWWENEIHSKIPLRRLSAEERVEIISKATGFNLSVAEKSANSLSSNFWTICKISNVPLDPFDGIELFKKDYLQWEDKEYISIDSALIHMDSVKNYVSETDKKAIRQIAQKNNK